MIQAACKSGEAYKAKLVADKLLLNGKQYTVKDIDMLPCVMHPSSLITVKKGDIGAFFNRRISSNHHFSSFIKDGVQFICNG